ncbi:MAG: phosphatase PAP2 family protein [Acidimicrobiales bacterium]
MGIDERVVRFLADHRFSLSDRLARAAVTAGTNRVLLLIAAAIAIAYVARASQWRAAAATTLAVVSAGLVANGLKLLIDRARPPADLAIVHAAGSSMPSTDAALTAAAGLAVVLAVSWPTLSIRRAGIGAIGAGVVVIGICLVYLGVHWPSDVLAGWLLGACAAAASVRVTGARRSASRAHASGGTGIATIWSRRRTSDR